jgi:hypothetical protein
LTVLKNVTFASVVNRKDVLENNLMASPCFQGNHSHQVLIQENYSSASKAYNDAIEKSRNDIIVFAHQDMIFPADWLTNLAKALTSLEIEDPNWGVLGCYGEMPGGGGRGYIYSHGLGILGAPFERPTLVHTLDEIVLILRKSSGLRFDDTLPNFHMYGADICMAAAMRGMKSYAISAFCIHNTTFNLVLPKEFYDCYKHVQRTRKELLPIQTTCIRITKFGAPMHVRRLREFYLRHIRNKRVGATRATDARRLLDVVQCRTKVGSLAGGLL